MKRLFFLLIVAVACVLPQSAWAGADLTGTTLTITTTAAGQVSGAVSSLSADQKAAVTKIVLDGYFNETDLQAIKGNEGDFTGVTEVDMAEAKFVTPIGSATENAQYKLFTSTTSGTANNGDRAIVGGTLYVSGKTPVWNSCSAPAEGTTVNILSNTTDISGHNVGDYGKIQNGYKYIQMDIISSSWDGPSTTAKSNATDLSAQSETTEYLNSILNSYNDNQSVWFYRYFISESYTEGNETKWRWNTTPTTQDAYEAATGSKYDNPYGVDLEHLDNSYAGDGNAMRVKVYYTKVVNREWTNETTDEQIGAIDLSAYDFAYHNNHKTGYDPGSGWVWFNDGDWVKLSNYDYYQFAGRWCLALGTHDIYRWRFTIYQ